MVNTENDIDTSKLNDSDKIQGLGVSSFIFPLIYSCFLGMASYNIFHTAQVNAYISVILGSLIGIIPFLLVMYILKNSGGEDIIDLNISLFGNVVGTIINAILNIALILFATLILYNLALFLDTQYIPDTSSLYVKILLITVIIYAASKSIATISRISQIIFIINLALFLLSCIGIVSEFDYNNLLPVLSDGIKPVVCGGIEYMIFGVLPLFLLTIIPTKLVKNKEHIMRNSSIMYIISSIIIFIIFLIITGVLGYEVISIYKYPEYMVLKKFSLFDIIERIENTLALQNVFSMFIFLTLIVYICSKSIKKVFNKLKSQELIPTLLGILILVLSNYIFENSSYATEFILKYIPYIVGIVLGVFILLTSITIFIRNLINKKSNDLLIQSELEKES